MNPAKQSLPAYCAPPPAAPHVKQTTPTLIWELQQHGVYEIYELLFFLFGAWKKFDLIELPITILTGEQFFEQVLEASPRPYLINN